MRFVVFAERENFRIVFLIMFYESLSFVED